MQNKTLFRPLVYLLLLCFFGSSQAIAQAPRFSLPNHLKLTSGDYTIPFIWSSDSANGRVEAHAAMFFPVKLPGCPVVFYLQFDTGSPSTLFYHHKLKAIQARYPAVVSISDTATRLKDFSFTVGSLLVAAAEIELRKFGSAEARLASHGIEVIGTIGTDFIDNRVAVIDYPKQQMIIGAELPGNLKAKAIAFSDFMYAGRRILLPATIRGQRTVLYFDSGSSAFELLTDKTTCETMAANGAVPVRYPVSSWGRTMTANSFAVKDQLQLGLQTIPLHEVTYMEGATDAQIQQMKGLGIGGMTGNKLFLQWMLVLDTKQKKFALVKLE